MRDHTDEERVRERLIVHHMPMARRLALRYRRGSDPVDDLFQVACLGLVKAVDRWDASRGAAFSSYALPTILGELRRYFRDRTWAVRPPRDLQELCLAVDKAREQQMTATGREPAVAELAALLGRSADDVAEALQAAQGRHAHSLEALVYDDEHDSATVGDLIGGDDPGYARAEAKATIDPLLAILDERAREVLRLRFAENLRQSEIADRVGCSQMHVSRIIRSALDAMYAHGGFADAAAA